MKIRFGLVFVIAALALAACAPAAPAEEAVMEEPAVEDTMEEEVMADDAMAADTMEDEAMEAEAMEEVAVAEDHDSMASDDAMAAEVSFSADVWPILEEFAVDAHGGKGGVFLESYDDILNYVVPGDPKNSMLYKALTADGMPQMPPSGPLPDEMIQTIYDWIAQGALNN